MENPRSMGWRTRLQLGGTMIALAAALTACGGESEQAIENAAIDGGSEPVSTVSEGVTGETIVIASPIPGSGPPEANTVIEAEGVVVSLENGQVNPDRLTGTPGDAFVLIVNGDGTEHTLAIEGLVTPETIAAEGRTRIAFTVAEKPGEFPILIDGKDAGIFAAQAPGGITS